jgi:general secretion pathway protein D
MINLVNADLRAAIQTLAQYLDRPVIFGAINAQPITLQTPAPVGRSEVPALLRTLLASQELEMVEENGAYRIVTRPAAVAPPVTVAPQQQTAPGGPQQLFVVHLHHARAADVAQVVNALYGRASALGELGAPRSPTTLGDNLRNSRVAPYGADRGVSQVSSAAGPSSGFEGDVVIVPDARTNSLLVRASQHDYELIARTVMEVDVQPLQVLIQATIAEVRRNSAFSIGLSARLHTTGVGNHGGTVSGSAGDSQGVDLTGLSVDLTGIAGGDLDVALRAGESRGSVSILSRPIVFAANNEEAEIVVGDQLPFVQVQRSTDGGVLDQVVQYKDVGTRLFVVPTISGDGYVQLQVTQEINNATGGTGVNGAPELSTRSVKTALLVGDGQTAVLGGLSSRQRDRGSGGVPYLSRIPLLGVLFGSRSRSSNDTELYVFLTPRIIRNDEELRSATETVRDNGGAKGVIRRAGPLILETPRMPSSQKPSSPAPQPPDSDPEHAAPPPREENRAPAPPRSESP